METLASCQTDWEKLTIEGYRNEQGSTITMYITCDSAWVLMHKSSDNLMVFHCITHQEAQLWTL